MAAGVLLIQEAGGLVGDPKGDQGFMDSGDVVAAAPKLFPSLLEALR
jgi:myo-inositol-1(or 4)-monophosphatase